MTVGDVFDIYKLTSKQSKILIWKYAASVIVPVAEASYPFLVYALTEATLGAALPLLSKIPLAAVIRGNRLSKMVRQIAKLGVPGSKSFTRIVKNSSKTKARALFDKITSNSIGPVEVIKTPKGNLLKANMGNGNKIMYRPFEASNTLGHEATIELVFKKIWNTNREIKFVK